MSAERWLPVVGHEGRYEVSDQGRVRSIRRRNPHIMTAFPEQRRGGYLKIRVRTGSKCIDFKVHRAVMEAFVGPLPAGLLTRHLNGDPTDNRLVNLTYGTPSENGHDTVRHGRNRQAASDRCKSGHAWSEENTRISQGRRRCRECERIRSLAYVERQRARPKGELIHGKIRSYIAGCRCDLCRQARSVAHYREKARRAAA